MHVSALTASLDTSDFEAAFLSAATSAFPGLAMAFDHNQISEQITRELLGSDKGRYCLTLGKPGGVTYIPDDSCTVRYDLELIDRSTGLRSSALVTARAFADRDSATGYYGRLAPLAVRLHGRGDVQAFQRCAATLENLDLTLAVFPADGDLPTLVDATDPHLMRSIFAYVLHSSGFERSDVRSCRVERGHYGRRHRCVLHYEIDLGDREAGEQQHLSAYGKLAGDDRGAVGSAAATALRARLTASPAGPPFLVPGSLGYHAPLRLALLEPIPGVAVMGTLIKDRARGQASSRVAALSLEDTLRAAAMVAAELHRSDIGLGPRRSLEEEVARLAVDLEALERATPEVSTWLRVVLSDVEARAGTFRDLPVTLCHGDFSPTQLLFNGTSCGLVDFDTICQAEPALDIGHFLANLRLATLKGAGMASGDHGLADQLSQMFFDSYATLTCRSSDEKELLRTRTSLYQMLSLIRLAIHSWQKFKMARCRHAMTLLEQGPW